MLNEAHTEIAETIDSWLLCTKTSRAQYMTKVVNRKSVVDGLFTWMAAVSQNCHLNILYMTGIWTTRCSEITVLTDPTVVYIVCCFLAMPAMWLVLDKDKSTDSEYFTPYVAPVENQHKFITIPLVLNDPVIDIVSWLNEIGLKGLGVSRPLQNVFAD